MGLRKFALVSLLIGLFSLSSQANEQENSFVEFKTTMGTVTVELFSGQAPLTVANFLSYVHRYYYDGLIFHRVVKDYIIQSGGYRYDLSAKEPGEAIPNESSNGLSNLRGTIAMARMPDPDSAKAQFFFNIRNNSNLDSHSDKVGYTVFGQVIKGLDVIDQIANVQVKSEDTFRHLPVEPVQILSIREITFDD